LFLPTVVKTVRRREPNKDQLPLLPRDESGGEDK
jgi:hypothetical protein